ncbi:MAG: tRNA pseudouridine(38-40) synthase TruA [Pseudomonadota bacterium]
MPRYKLIIEYDGTHYSGWQAQNSNGARGVQNVLMQAIESFCGEQVSVAGAGRTDAGVHASGQVAHIDLSKDWQGARIRDALNAHLREEAVSVVDAKKVADDFDARFSAKKRHYLYRILNRRAPPALESAFVWHVLKPLDIDAMQEGAQYLIGKHDFTTFRHARCQAKSPIKNLDRIEISRCHDEIYIEAESLSFLHAQVRSIVGSLRVVGEGREEPSWIKQILEAKDRSLCGALAPPQGLTLTRVDYE